MIEKSEKESYLHNEAKQLLLKWLRKTAEKSEEIEKDCYCSFCGIKWRVNRGPPFYGVFDEYPITNENEGPQVWDERGWDEQTYPDYKWMKEHYGDNFKIPDIVITHKGCILYIIEIEHKNLLTQEKIDYYNNCCIFCGEIIKIPAQWIMGQIKEPKSIPLEFYV